MMSIKGIKGVAFAAICSSTLAFAASASADPVYPLEFTQSQLNAAFDALSAAQQELVDYNESWKIQVAWNERDVDRMWCKYDYDHNGMNAHLYLECMETADIMFEAKLDVIQWAVWDLQDAIQEAGAVVTYMQPRCCLPE